MVFGEEGSGKTDLAVGVSRMTDRYLYIDNEGSTTAYLLHPYSQKEPWGLVNLGPKSVNRVKEVLAEELRNVQAGKARWDAVVLDGLTEYQIVKAAAIATERSKEDAKEDPLSLSPRGWGYLLRDLLEIAQLAVELSTFGTTIILTAGAEIEGGEVKPFCQGAFGRLVGRYFDLSIYVKNEPVEGKPKHVYYLLKSGLFRGKNRWEDVWLRSPQKYPSSVVNVKLEKLLELIQNAAEEKAKEGVTSG